MTANNREQEQEVNSMEQTGATITTEEVLVAMEQTWTRFGVMTLGQLLLTSYQSHLGNFHVPQLEAFLASQD